MDYENKNNNLSDSNNIDVIDWDEPVVKKEESDLSSHFDATNNPIVVDDDIQSELTSPFENNYNQFNNTINSINNQNSVQTQEFSEYNQGVINDQNSVQTPEFSEYNQGVINDQNSVQTQEFNEYNQGVINDQNSVQTLEFSEYNQGDNTGIQNLGQEPINDNELKMNENIEQNAINNETKDMTITYENKDDQKSGITFILILFVVLAIFIFVLPYITKLF